MSNYFEKIENNFDSEIKNEANIDNVPIVKDDTLKLILFLVRIKNIKKVLEVGTAIAYTAINLAKAGCSVDTIEINDKMYEKACMNVKENNLENKINLIKGDALEIPLESLQKDYDLIFIDAAKAQYRRFFERFSPLLNENGIIVVDNLLFHGFVNEYSETGDVSGSRNLRGLARKIDNFNHYLVNNNDYETTFLELGDGVALCVKKRA